MMGPEEKRRRWQRVRALGIALSSELGVLGTTDSVAKALQVTAAAVVVNANIEMAESEHGEDLSSGN